MKYERVKLRYYELCFLCKFFVMGKLMEQIRTSELRILEFVT